MIAQQGISIRLPPGWEARITGRASGPAPAGEASGPGAGAVQLRSAASVASPPPPDGGALVHAANFALPTVVGDFGGGAVEVMSRAGVLVVIFEYDRASAATALFADAEGLPRVRADDFSPTALQRLLDGQGGAQKFFTVAGRAFCLYVVLGAYTRRARAVPEVNLLLDGVDIA
ncbi:MAG: hypothetical protein ACT4PW_13705 [Acidimicrobiia bacterium]